MTSPVNFCWMASQFVVTNTQNGNVKWQLPHKYLREDTSKFISNANADIQEQHEIPIRVDQCISTTVPSKLISMLMGCNNVTK